MPKVTLNKQTETSEALLSSYGCLSRKHVVSICNNDEDKARKIISFLIKYGATRTTDDEQILLPNIKRLHKLDMNTLDCLTVAIDLMQDEDNEYGLDLDALINSFESEPVKINIVDKDNQYLNIVPINETNLTTTIAFLKEKFLRIHKKPEAVEGIVYIFVIKDKAMLNQIGDMRVPFEHKIALLSKSKDDETDIKYFSPKS